MLKPSEPNSEIAALLQPKERILWTGRPYDGIVIQGADILITAIALVFMVFMLIGVGDAIIHGKFEGSLLVVILVFMVPCYFAFGRLFVNAWLRSKWLYAITSERAITIVGVDARSVRSVYLAKIAETMLIEKRNGWGTIVLGPVLPWERWTWRERQAVDFEHLEGVRGVYDILCEARRTAKERGP